MVSGSRANADVTFKLEALNLKDHCTLFWGET